MLINLPEVTFYMNLLEEKEKKDVIYNILPLVFQRSVFIT